MSLHLNKNKMQILTEIYMTGSYSTDLSHLSSQYLSFSSPYFFLLPKGQVCSHFWTFTLSYAWNLLP